VKYWYKYLKPWFSPVVNVGHCSQPDEHSNSDMHNLETSN
jgi:hypothetical protein